MVAVAPCGRGDAGDVGAGTRFGHGEGEDRLAGDGAGQPASLLLLVGLVQQVRQGDVGLQRQAEQGSPYLVVDALTAADVYWATMSMCVTATPPDIMPVTQQNKGMLKFFAANSQLPMIANVLSKRIEDHQRYILTTYCETPAVLGGDPL